MKMENGRVKHFLSFLLILCLAKISTTTTAEHYPEKIPSLKKHFVLVHGDGHGAWCWYKLATLLKSVGHEVTSLDLAASGINPIHAEKVHSLADYAEPLIIFMGSQLQPTERIILVGHSSGGAVISFAMESFPEKIAAAVYAAAVMPGPALSFLTICEELRERWKLIDYKYSIYEGSTSILFGPNQVDMASRVYQLSPPEDSTLALSLMRIPPVYGKELTLTEMKYGSVPRVFIACDQDLTIEEDLQMWMIEKNPPNEVKVINGSDHMVMFSRPIELFTNLIKIAEQYS